VNCGGPVDNDQSGRSGEQGETCHDSPSDGVPPGNYPTRNYCHFKLLLIPGGGNRCGRGGRESSLSAASYELSWRRTYSRLVRFAEVPKRVTSRATRRRGRRSPKLVQPATAAVPQTGDKSTEFGRFPTLNRPERFSRPEVESAGLGQRTWPVRATCAYQCALAFGVRLSSASIATMPNFLP
jgi:hypothetical protein